MEDYYRYLLTNLKFSVGTSSIYLIYFKKIVRNAVNQEILFHNPFSDFATIMKDPIHKTLSKEELERFMAYDKKSDSKKSKDIL
ncbi:phage integrase SAM-like domain-containing protein [Apibacter adventoris]|uniref:phage integrase SAM-like domain-containing protein n=1 Tax=Apibacter adventoris TaxID=1679466 RepID=UPI0015E28C1A